MDNNKFLSPQIARYDNGKNILEFNSRLNTASVYNAFKIHAGTDETYNNGVKMKSQINIKLISYGKDFKKTGDAEANIDIANAKYLWTAVQKKSFGVVLQQTRIHGFKKDENGKSVVQSLTIKREDKAPDGSEYKLQWFVEIAVGKAEAIDSGVGYKKDTYVLDKRLYIRIGTGDFYELVSQLNTTITAWEFWAACRLFTKREKLETEIAERKANNGSDSNVA